MNQDTKTAFTFENFTIEEFSFSNPGIGRDISNTISVGLEPSGSYNVEKEIFSLQLNYRAAKGEGSEQEVFIKAKLIGEFNIPGVKEKKDIPEYFYANSVAIIYPYLRAFITTLTTQAGVKPIIMPIMNLSQLEQPLKEATVIS